MMKHIFGKCSNIWLECMTISKPWWRNGNSDGMATSQDPLAWRRQLCKGQWKKQEGREDRRRDGKITSRNGREWGLEIPEGSGRQGRMERYCCNVICGTPTTSKVKGLRWGATFLLFFFFFFFFSLLPQKFKFMFVLKHPIQILLWNCVTTVTCEQKHNTASIMIYAGNFIWLECSFEVCKIILKAKRGPREPVRGPYISRSVRALVLTPYDCLRAF